MSQHIYKGDQPMTDELAEEVGFKNPAELHQLASELSVRLVSQEGLSRAINILANAYGMAMAAAVAELQPKTAEEKRQIMRMLAAAPESQCEHTLDKMKQIELALRKQMGDKIFDALFGGQPTAEPGEAKH